MALAEDVRGHHSAPSPNVFDAFGLGHDDPPNLFLLPYDLENTTPSSGLDIGNLESAPADTFDVHTSDDYDFGFNEFSTLFTDDYLNSGPTDLLSNSSFGVDTAPLATQGSMLAPKSLHNSSPLASSSPSGSSQDLGRPETGLLPETAPTSSKKSTSPETLAKMGIAPSLSFKCSECQKTFAFESRYNAHMDTHTTVTCSFIGCTSTFKDIRSRERHLKSKHGNHRFGPCPMCNRDFNRDDKLKMHVRACSKKRKRDTA